MTIPFKIVAEFRDFVIAQPDSGTQVSLSLGWLAISASDGFRLVNPNGGVSCFATPIKEEYAKDKQGRS